LDEAKVDDIKLDETTRLSNECALPFVAFGDATCFETRRCCVFSFEEAIGYQIGNAVFDKDGIGALRVVLQLAAHAYARGMSLCSLLDSLYDRYGYHRSSNSYFVCYEAPTIRRMFDRLRNFVEPLSSTEKPTLAQGETHQFVANINGTTYRYPTHCGRFSVCAIRDLTVGFDSDAQDGKPMLPLVESGQMITFRFRGSLPETSPTSLPHSLSDDAYEIVLTIRTSGTEPKIKYYSELCETRKQTRYSRAQLDAILDELVAAAIENFYEPEKNNLTWRK
jgi:phosphomannomutase